MLDPFSPGTTSLALYADPAPPAVMLERIFEQGRAAARAGVDGLTISEHHAGFAPYLPNPLQLAGWLLDRTEGVWVGPCPFVLPLHPTAAAVEELAWLAALHPNRVGAGVAPGYARGDFAVYGIPFDARVASFTAALPVLVSGLSGRALPPLIADPAVAATAGAPVPIVATAGSATAARRAATTGCGIVTDSLATVEAVSQLFATYAEAGGHGPKVVNRRVWVGDVPTELVERQAAHYAEAAGDGSWLEGSTLHHASGTAQDVAAQLHEVVSRTGADHLGLKVHLEGVGHIDAMRQIEALGDVITDLRRRWSPSETRLDGQR